MNRAPLTPEDIDRRVWLAQRPGIIAELAERLGVSPSMVHGVLTGRRRSKRVADALAAAGAPGFARRPRRRQ